MMSEFVLNIDEACPIGVKYPYPAKTQLLYVNVLFAKVPLVTDG